MVRRTDNWVNKGRWDKEGLDLIGARAVAAAEEEGGTEEREREAEGVAGTYRRGLSSI